MDIIYFRRHFSRNTLFRMVLLVLLVTGLVIWKLDSINTVYFRDQLTTLGLTINGAIVVLFLLGMLRIVVIFLGYTREEAILTRFIKNQNKEDVDPLKGISPKSIIGRRYLTMQRLHESHTIVNQGALASTLMASESTKISLPKFINNTLILSGVFGTIVSLSIALLGASDLLADSVNVDGMGMVIHGMSTALSTTITAIICYLLLGYFYLKLTDAQTNLVSAVEQVTTNYLVPKFQVQTDTVLYEFTGLIRSLQGLVSQMQNSQQLIEKVEGHLVQSMDSYHSRVDNLSDDMTQVIKLLRTGFRLSDDD